MRKTRSFQPGRLMSGIVLEVVITSKIIFFSHSTSLSYPRLNVILSVGENRQNYYNLNSM